MPRKSKQTAEEIFEAEKYVADRQESRKSGYNLMAKRDQGIVRLSNGVYMRWPVVRQPAPAGVDFWQWEREVPEGIFVLEIDGKEISFDTDEFRRWLRWA